MLTSMLSAALILPWSLQGGIEFCWERVGKYCISEAFQILSLQGGVAKKKKKSITSSSVQKGAYISLAKVIKPMTNMGFTFLCFQTAHKAQSVKWNKLLWN